MRAKRSLGQNFLVDANTQRLIVEALAVMPGDRVLEIGPGRGALTRILAELPCDLILVELDDRLAADLAEDYGQHPRVRVIHENILDIDLRELDPVEELKVVGNIPYNITTPILFHLLSEPRPQEILIMVQREVADRIAALPGTKAYGALAVGVRSVATVEQVLRVSRNAFRPIPKVDSSVIRIRPLHPSPLTGAETRSLRILTRALFGWRRKQLQKTLRDHPDLRLTRDEVARVMSATGLDPMARPERYAPEELLLLSRTLGELGKL